MNLVNQENVSAISSSLRPRDNDLRVAVTDATTDIALALLYKLFADNVFGENQPVLINLYEFKDRSIFLESIATQVKSFCPSCLKAVSYTHDASIAFKDADIVFAIGRAREYEFSEEEYTDLFFEDSVLIAKCYGEFIEKYAKKDANVIVLGTTAATIISRYAKTISPKNITSMSMFNLKITAAYIAHQAECLPTEIKNIIIWGSNNKYTFPDCRYVSFQNETIVDDKLEVWLRNDLPQIIQSIVNRPWYIRSLAYALADHCKILWNGTPYDEWTCMGVLSDNSYDVRSGIFFSYPVYCQNKQYEIVQGLVDDEYVKKHILSLSKLIRREIHAALKICGLN